MTSTPATTPEKPAKWATFLFYFIVLCAGIFAWRTFAGDKPAAAEPSPVVETPRAEPTPEPPAPVVEPEKPKTRKGFKLSAATLIAAYEANEVSRR